MRVEISNDINEDKSNVSMVTDYVVLNLIKEKEG